MSNMDTDEPETSIEEVIMKAGAGGKKAVSTGQARSIAEQKINTFVQTRMDLLERVDS